MTREAQRPFAHRHGARQHAMPRAAINFLVRLHQHAVVEKRQTRGLHHFAVRDDRRRERHVVALPFTGWTTRVHQRRRLRVDGCALPIRRPLLVEGIKNLNLVEAVDEDAAVALIVPGPLEVGGRLPFQMQLKAAEFPDKKVRSTKPMKK